MNVKTKIIEQLDNFIITLNGLDNAIDIDEVNQLNTDFYNENIYKNKNSILEETLMFENAFSKEIDLEQIPTNDQIFFYTLIFDHKWLETINKITNLELNQNCSLKEYKNSRVMIDLLKSL
jgi:hypothetical protein